MLVLVLAFVLASPRFTRTFPVLVFVLALMLMLMLASYV